ncbi:MAG: serine/threonine-protein kinase [Polyangiaceae bacterium]
MANGLRATSESMVGATLSARYRLLRLVGEGGVGAVFEAHDLMGSTKCALKLLRPEYAAEGRVVAQLFAEALKAARLAHPNIARCFGHAPADEPIPYVVSELVEGASVASYLRPGLAYETPQAIPIARGLLAAISEAHRQGIVHGDLKPENVFLIPRPDGPPTVKVTDFGMAKVMEAAGGMMTRTRSGAFLGSPGYMSPEQVRGAREVGPSSDLWSITILLYQLLTGREPFPAPTDAAKLTLILSTDAAPIDQGKPHLSAWRGLFVRGLARDPAERFGSAEEMEAAMLEAASIPVKKSLGVSATDMSPQLAPAVAVGRPSGHAQVEVVRTPRPPPPPPPEGVPATDSTLRAGQVPMMLPKGTRVPLWLTVVIALLCLAGGFVAGYFVAQM